MAKQPIVVVLLLTVTSLAGLWVPASAQTPPAGYVDPELTPMSTHRMGLSRVIGVSSWFDLCVWQGSTSDRPGPVGTVSPADLFSQPRYAGASRLLDRRLS